jgi:hypothetical protein
MNHSASSGATVLRPGAWLAFFWLAAMLAGCASGGSKSIASHGGITIKGRAVTDVILTTRDVFTKNGYVLAKAEPNRMVFERPGTRAEQVKYGSFGSPHVTIRAKVDLQDMGAETFFLRCDAFAVRDAGESMLEDESRLILFSNKAYQKIMDEIQTQLDAPVAPSAPGP